MNNRKLIIIFSALFVLFNLYATTRFHPVNVTKEENFSGRHGDLDRNAIRIYRIAKTRAEKPYNEVKDHLLFHGRNPGLFIYVAEIFLRYVSENPLWIHLWALFLTNLGLIALYYWVKILFQNDILGLLSLIFMMMVSYIPYYSTSIHMDPYVFAFFNFTVLFFLLFLKKKYIHFFALALLSYFIVCSNYYMYYVSTFIFLIGLNYTYKRKLFNRENIAIALIPVLAIISTILLAAYAHGSVREGLFKLYDIFMARTFDIKIEGTEWHPNKKFMGWADWILYPNTVSTRVFYYFNLRLEFFFILLFYAYKIARNDHKKYFKYFYFIIPAGLSWNVLMFQHTKIHGFSAIYGFFLYMLIFSIFVYQVKLHYTGLNKIWNINKNKFFRFHYVLSVIFLIIFIYGFLGKVVKDFFVNVKNIYIYESEWQKVNYSNLMSIKNFQEKYKRTLSYDVPKSNEINKMIQELKNNHTSK